MAYAVGLVGLLMVKILAPGFYAKQDIRTPVKIAIAVLIATQLLNFVLVPWLAHAGLALSIGLGGCLNALALFVGLRRQGIYIPGPGWLKFLGKQIVALTFMALPLALSAHYLNWIALQANPALRVLWLGLILTGAMAVYLGILMLLGLRPKDFRRAPSTKTVGKTVS
jgi:putative peptidoglycan lipid II flippase